MSEQNENPTSAWLRIWEHDLGDVLRSTFNVFDILLPLQANENR